MRYTLLFLVTLGYGQDFGGNWYLGGLFNNTGSIVKSTEIIDSVVFDGLNVIDSIVTGGWQSNNDDFHNIYKKFPHKEHKWIYEYSPLSMNRCGVIHGILGCPDDWSKGYRICKSCYRKEYFHEKRWVEKVKSEIETLNEIVDSLRNKK